MQLDGYLTSASYLEGGTLIVRYCARVRNLMLALLAGLSGERDYMENFQPG